MSEAKTVLAVDRTDLALRKAGIDATLSQLEEIEPALGDEALWANHQSHGHDLVEVAKSELDTLIAPSLASVAEARDAFRPLLEAAAKYKALCSAKLKAIGQLALDAQDAATKAAQDAAEAGDAEACHDALAAIPDAVKADGAAMGWEWVAVVTDKAAVPETHKKVDEASLKKIGAKAKKAGVVPACPGVKFEKRATARVGRKRDESEAG